MATMPIETDRQALLTIWTASPAGLWEWPGVPQLKRGLGKNTHAHT